MEGVLKGAVILGISHPYGRPLGVLRAGALVEPAGSASAGG